MKISIGMVMDPIESIKPYKDSSFAMLLAAQARGWQLFYLQQKDLFLKDDQCYAHIQTIKVTDSTTNWFSLGKEQTIPLDQLNAIFMRKDPPFDMEYIYTTYLLELAERRGTLIVNKPQSLRDANEKLFTTQFTPCCTPMLVSRQDRDLRAFIELHDDVILKPLDGMGGASIFRLRKGDPNISVIIETLTNHGQSCTMAQRFIPEIKEGDKRILMVNGEAIPYALARIPAKGETRGNLAAGGRGEGIPLSERDHWIAKQVGPKLREMGIIFAGLDVIGDYLTEINITSPTCIRELDGLFNLNIADQLMSAVEQQITQ
jgi:glutathione synthase